MLQKKSENLEKSIIYFLKITFELESKQKVSEKLNRKLQNRNTVYEIQGYVFLQLLIPQTKEKGIVSLDLGERNTTVQKNIRNYPGIALFQKIVAESKVKRYSRMEPDISLLT